MSEQKMNGCIRDRDGLADMNANEPNIHLLSCPLMGESLLVCVYVMPHMCVCVRM